MEKEPVAEPTEKPPRKKRAPSKFSLLSWDAAPDAPNTPHAVRITTGKTIKDLEKVVTDGAMTGDFEIVTTRRRFTATETKAITITAN